MINNLIKRINLKNNNSIMLDILFFLILVFIGTIGRTLLVGWKLQPFPNFEIIMVITFISVIYLRPNFAFFVPLLCMIFSDLLVGNSIIVGNQQNRIVLFTYSGFALISLFNIINKDRFKNKFTNLNKKNLVFAAGFGIGFVLLYDIWTNFGWWFLIYPHTMNSLIQVFLNGIPFMIYHSISGVITFVLIALPVISFINKKNKNKLDYKLMNYKSIPVVALTFFLIILSFTGTAMNIPKKSEIWLENSDETSVKISIICDDWIINDNVIAFHKDTVFSILRKFSEKNDISFEYTYYKEFESLLIDSIFNFENGEDNRYWQYYVGSYENGEIPPMIGCDKYRVTNGDIIEWRFEIISY